MRLYSILIVTIAFLIEIETRKLIMIQSTFRHGARYPLNSESSDYSDFAETEHRMGELTDEGRHMQYLLGKVMYKKYWKQLFAGTEFQEKYHPSIMYVKSTNVNRTIESAQSQLIGWLQQLRPLTLSPAQFQYSLPPYSSLKSYAQIDWNASEWPVYGSQFLQAHPIPIHTEKEIVRDTPRANPYDQGDFLLKYEKENCPNQVFWSKESFVSEEAMQIRHNSKVKDAIKRLADALQEEISFDDAYKHIDGYICEKYLGRKYLQLFNDRELEDTFNFINIASMILAYHNKPIQIRTAATRFLQATTANIHRAIQANGPRLILYSAHDTTILALLTAMNFTSLACIKEHYLRGANNSASCVWQYPPFASNLVIELWREDDGSYSVAVVYNGETKRIPVCSYKEACPLQQLKSWVSSFVVQSPNEECGIRQHYLKLYIVIAILSFLVLILIIIQIRKHLQKKLLKKMEEIEERKKYMEGFEQKEEQA